MKIVLVLHFKLDRNAGAAGVLLALKEQFAASGHDVATISHDDGLTRLPTLLRDVIFPFAVAARLLFRHADADVIEGATGDCWVYFLARRRRLNTLFVSFSHGLYRPLHDRLMRDRASGAARVSWKYWMFRGSFLLWQEAWSMRVADLVYVLNADERRFAIEAQGVDPARVKIVRNGIGDHLQRHALRVAETAPAIERSGIVQVGSYEERKGVQVTVAATTRLMQARGSLRIAFLGTVRPGEEVHRDYPEPLRDRVTVLPRFDNRRLPELLAPYQIFVMPSTYEGFGIAPLEAMACGLVPIVTDIAGPAEYVVDGVNGLVIPVDSPDALGRAIIRLIDDAGLHARLRTGAIATARGFDWHSIAIARLRDYRLFGSMKRRTEAPGVRRVEILSSPLQPPVSSHGDPADELRSGPMSPRVE